MESWLLVTPYSDNCFVSGVEPIRPIPEKDDWFEAVWNEFIERTNMPK